jgi:hypothetical protein
MPTLIDHSRVWNTRHGPVKLGRTERTYGHVASITSLRAARGTPLPALPVTLNNAKTPDVAHMFLNSQFGCCTIAGGANLIDLTSFDAQGSQVKITNANILTGYEANCPGFNPKTGANDNGCNMQDVLRWWLTEGFPVADGSRVKALAVFEVNSSDVNGIAEVIAEFGAAYTGEIIPGGFMDATSEGPPTLWIDDPKFFGTEGGHCTCLTGFDRSSGNPESYLYPDTTWGTNAEYTMRGDFLAKYVDEVYAVLLPGWIEKSGKTPYGLSVDQLIALGGEIGQDLGAS